MLPELFDLTPLTKTHPLPRQRSGFTIVEVMMAACILTVGFIGLIEAITITSTAMDQARRQTLATQIITHEIEKLYLSSWTTISGLPTTSTTITIDSQFDQARLAVGDDKSTMAPVQFTMTRTVTSPTLTGDPELYALVTNPVTMVEVNFTVQWVVRTSRLDSSGNRVTFTYTRSNSAWYGKNGLHLSYRNS